MTKVFFLFIVFIMLAILVAGCDEPECSVYAETFTTTVAVGGVCPINSIPSGDVCIVKETKCIKWKTEQEI